MDINHVSILKKMDIVHIVVKKKSNINYIYFIFFSVTESSNKPFAQNNVLIKGTKLLEGSFNPYGNSQRAPNPNFVEYQKLNKFARDTLKKGGKEAMVLAGKLHKAAKEALGENATMAAKVQKAIELYNANPNKFK